MSRKRKHINLRTQLAAALLHIPQRDAFGRVLVTDSGHAIPCIPFEKAQKMTAKQIRSRFDLDHCVLHHFDGGEHPTNLTFRLKAEHKAKTRNDRKIIAKVNRVVKAREAIVAAHMAATNDLRAINAKLDTLPKHAPDRRKRKAVIPGSKASDWRKPMRGRAERRT